MRKILANKNVYLNQWWMYKSDIERVAGIEPASLAWKARGYSRRWFIIFNVSNSKPNMKF